MSGWSATGRDVPRAASLLVAVVLLLPACTRFAPSPRDTAGLPLPASFTLYGPAAPAPAHWWETFASDELDALVARALGGNFTLEQARARLRQASAAAAQAGAARWPEVSYSAGASVARVRTDTGYSVSSLDLAETRLGAVNTLLTPPASSTRDAGLRAAETKLRALDTLLSSPPDGVSTVTRENYALGLNASYELDLWGRLRAREQAALGEYEASREQLFAAMQTVAAQTVLTWLDMLMYWQVIDVVHRQLEANRTSLELVELRFRKGLASALDVFQQRQAVARSESLLPPYEARLEVLRHELAALLGEPPRTALDIGADHFPELPPLPDQGLPADLLARRPDVRAAGLRLHAADWQVSAARADRLPAVRLTPSFNFEAGEWDLLLDNWMARLAASVTGPLFDAGRRKAEVARARAAADERLAVYKQAVVTAVKEVENALANEAKQAEYVEALRRELAAAEAGHTEALARYRKGLNDYLPVLSALSNAQTLERGLVFAAHDRLVYRVQLHLALGGDWMGAAAPEEE